MDEELKQEYETFLKEKATAIKLKGHISVDYRVLELLDRKFEISERQKDILSNEANTYWNAMSNGLSCGVEEFVGDDEMQELRLETIEYNRLQAEFEGREYIPDPNTCQECGDEACECPCNRCDDCGEKKENCECEEEENAVSE